MVSLEQTLESVVKLAVMTCACDGEIHPKEDSLLKEWMNNKPDKFGSTMSRAFKNAMQQLKGEGLELKEVCETISQNAPIPLKYDAMELCLRIAQVDGIGADEEMRFLMSVGKWLDLDYAKFREMRDKILPSTIHENIDVDALLGLHAGMSKDEKQKHLTREYSRWNQLTTHNDPRKREQAHQMLEIIAKKRSELTNE